MNTSAWQPIVGVNPLQAQTSDSSAQVFCTEPNRGNKGIAALPFPNELLNSRDSRQHEDPNPREE